MKDLILKIEAGKFTNEKTGEIVEYNRYYVELMGIKVYLKPNDLTSKQLLESVLKNK